MRKTCPLLAAITCALIANLLPAHPLMAAEEIGFIERFALAEDRTAVLEPDTMIDGMVTTGRAVVGVCAQLPVCDQSIACLR